ncbi:lipid IV(A) 3-deoxy-D-manno-octulosonic acid transferase [Calditerrivibrio sp.]|uniref:lipid IV(A) 3-deoxy-D-manno-octulosonic acid transferase n=1 Tax=Calditerrivibrio sp. TaxID=2792612 RepID=UPI003D0E8B67
MIIIFLFLYNLLFLAILPFLFLSLIFKGFKNIEYLKRWNERLGFVKRLPPKRRVWIHALSLGEVNAATPLIRRLQSSYPDYDILVTTTTPTGSAQVQKNFGGSIEHFYLPYDFAPLVDIFLINTKPTIGIIIETEIWPNLINLSYKHAIKLFLVNGRLSEKSLKRYLIVKPIFLNLLNRFAILFVRDNSDAFRFKQLGVNEEKIEVAGNIKFDMKIDERIYEKSAKLKDTLSGKFVWVCGSTHAGEEEIILKIFSKLKDEFKNLFLIIAPRDPLRSREISKLADKYKLKSIHRTKWEPNSNQQFDLLIVDTLGELLLFYSLGHLSFIGGSLVPKGGHNPLEPISLGVPTIAGKFVYNFSELYEVLQKEEIVQLVNNSDELYSVVKSIISNPDKRGLMSENGINYMKKNKGAIDTIIKKLKG